MTKLIISNVRLEQLVFLLMLLLIVPGKASGQRVSTSTLVGKKAEDFARLSEYYDFGYKQWHEEAQKAQRGGNNTAAEVATVKATAWLQAKQVAELAETKSSLVGGEVKMLPTPGVGSYPHPSQKTGGIQVLGKTDSAVNSHNDGSEPPLGLLYKDYIRGMSYWYGHAVSAKSVNNPAEVQTAVRNAQAFEDAYMSIKNAEIKAVAAGAMVAVTPVTGLPRYPSAQPLQAVVANTNTISPAFAPTPVPLPVSNVSSTPFDATSGTRLTRANAQMPTSATIAQSAASKVVVLADGSFTKTTLEGSWVVEFGATWCGPCKAMKPIMDQLSSELSGSVKFGTVDVDKNRAFLKRYKVKAYPTFILMKNGVVVATEVGGMSKQKLTAFATR